MRGAATICEGLTGREVNLARSQINVLRYIAGHMEAHGYAPSVRKIAGALGRTSLGGVHGDLEELTDQGLIRRLRNRACAIEVLTPPAVPRAPDGASSLRRPLHGGWTACTRGGWHDRFDTPAPDRSAALRCACWRFPCNLRSTT